MSRSLNREEKLELVERMLGLRHKLKVHDSMKSPETHEELASSLLSRWELEDELHAIESIIQHERSDNVKNKATQLQDDYLSGKKPLQKKKK